MSQIFTKLAPRLAGSLGRLEPIRTLAGGAAGLGVAHAMQEWNPGHDMPVVGRFFHEDLNPVAERAMLAKYALIGGLLARSKTLRNVWTGGPVTATVNGRLFDLRKFSKKPWLERELGKIPHMGGLAKVFGRSPGIAGRALKTTLHSGAALTIPYVTGHTLTSPAESWMQKFLLNYDTARMNKGGDLLGPIRGAMDKTIKPLADRATSRELLDKARGKLDEVVQPQLDRASELVSGAKEVLNEAVQAQMDTTLPPLAYNIAASLAAGIGAGALVPASYSTRQNRHETVESYRRHTRNTMLARLAASTLAGTGVFFGMKAWQNRGGLS